MNNREENIILNDEKRFAGDYEILQAIQIGDKEVVLGENLTATDNEKYICAYCTSNDLIACYDEVMVSDNYAEIVELFGTRVSQQATKEVNRLENSYWQSVKPSLLLI